MPALAPYQWGGNWQADYETDMNVALAFIRALAQRRVSLALQPIVRLPRPAKSAKRARGRYADTTPVLYHEALVRFDLRPDDAGLSAVVLVPALERLGLIQLLDHAVLVAVIARLQHDPDLYLGCNLSASSLIAMSGWWSSVLAQLRADPSIAQRLTLEITETAPLPDFDRAVAFADELRGLGCSLAIDDFGCGHTRLDFMRAVRPHVIKLSSELTHLATHDKAALAEMKCVVTLATALAPAVVAEGISGQIERHVADRIGVDWLQGYDVASPAAAQPRLCLDLPSLPSATIW